ncbi:hypothetical protein [Mycobacterium uberis]|uniref:hypothetical protein n=1 Tax=Mycobacterium uberis TaxID=2162698 RepID=UPI0014030645|nr:hypothetical protein [Mycobacterium uberis]
MFVQYIRKRCWFEVGECAIDVGGDYELVNGDDAYEVVFADSIDPPDSDGQDQAEQRGRRANFDIYIYIYIYISSFVVIGLVVIAAVWEALFLAEGGVGALA